jgi:DNA polymerase-3 subunit epsilon
MKFFNDYVIIDIETTGLNLDNGDRITSISGLKIINNQIQDQFFSLVNVDVPIDPMVEEITGISNRLLKDASSGMIVFRQFLSFIGGLPVVAHNAEFDKKFLENELCILDLHVFLQYTDTLIMARKMFPGQRCSIDALLEKLNLQSQAIKGFYSSDVKNTYQIYEAMKKRYFV